MLPRGSIFFPLKVALVRISKYTLKVVTLKKNAKINIHLLVILSKLPNF